MPIDNEVQLLSPTEAINRMRQGKRVKLSWGKTVYWIQDGVVWMEYPGEEATEYGSQSDSLKYEREQTFIREEG